MLIINESNELPWFFANNLQIYIWSAVQNCSDRKKGKDIECCSLDLKSAMMKNYVFGPRTIEKAVPHLTDSRIPSSRTRLRCTTVVQIHRPTALDTWIASYAPVLKLLQRAVRHIQVIIAVNPPLRGRLARGTRHWQNKRG